MCCIISGEPIADETGRYYTSYGQNQVKFQTDMMKAPCAECPSSCCWFCFQFIPITSGCAQYWLRRKVLKGDMSKYSCFQGYTTICCCIKAGACGEESCPDLCAFAEGCCCNCVAVSVSRQYVMEEYNLESDPCDYRLIRINNCIQCFACICTILAMIDDGFRALSEIVNRIADLFYHTVSGCMTAQVAHEVNYQTKIQANSHNQAYPAAQQYPKY